MSPPDPADDLLAEHATALADAVADALPGWVQRCVRERMGTVPPEVEREAQAAGIRAQREVAPAVRALLSADVDEQRANPLALLRDAVRYPTEVLTQAGVAPSERDDFSRDRFPDDVYDLTPASWRDIDASLAGPGIAWGAAKAFVHRRRHARPALGD